MNRFTLALLATLAAAGCGQNEAQPEEVNTPESAAAMKETEAQREQQNFGAEEQKEAEEFDAKEQ